MQGFGPEAKTRRGTLGFPARTCIHTKGISRSINKRNVLVVREFSRFDETRCARWSRVMVSVTCNYKVGFRHLREGNTLQLQHGMRYDFSEINLLRNDRDSDLKQIENKDPEEKNSSEGIVGNSEVY